MLQRLKMRVPVVLAPMAGISTPELAAAVSDAGGLGSLGLAAMDADAAREALRRTRALMQREAPINANVFCHTPPPRDSEREAAWLSALAPDFGSVGASPPMALHDSYAPLDHDPDMLDMLLAERPGVVSFHFGLPSADSIAKLRDSGAVLLATATSRAEAEAIAAAGLDAIVAQGWQAGGHRGIFDENRPDRRLPTLDLLAELRDLDLPLIAAGGIMTAEDVRAVLDAGAFAAQCGTAFLPATEAATSQPHRDGLAHGRTIMTRAVSGRPARGLENRITTRDDSEAPPYPLPYSALKLLHREAVAIGEHGFGPFWAGTGCTEARPGSAAEILSRLTP